MRALPSTSTSEAIGASFRALPLCLLSPALGFHQTSHLKNNKSLQAFSTPPSPQPPMVLSGESQGLAWSLGHGPSQDTGTTSLIVKSNLWAKVRGLFAILRGTTTLEHGLIGNTGWAKVEKHHQQCVGNSPPWAVPISGSVILF